MTARQRSKDKGPAYKAKAATHASAMHDLETALTLTSREEKSNAVLGVVLQDDSTHCRWHRCTFIESSRGGKAILGLLGFGVATLLFNETSHTLIRKNT